MEQVATSQIKIEQVGKVYSGRPGCACGCRGKHTYRPETAAWGAERRGYAVEPAEVSTRSCTAILKKVNEFIAQGLATLDTDYEPHVWVETETRLYVIHLLAEAK